MTKKVYASLEDIENLSAEELSKMTYREIIKLQELMEIENLPKTVRRSAMSDIIAAFRKDGMKTV